MSVTLQLTSYPNNYENNMACLWLFTGLPNASIIFDTYIVNITAPDKLLFGNGHDPGVPLSTVAVLPGILPTGSRVVVSDSLAWVQFISDSEVTSGGFSVGVRVLYEKGNDRSFIVSVVENLKRNFCQDLTITFSVAS